MTREQNLVRLWVDGEDLGTMTAHAAELYLQVHETQWPDEPTRVEPVDDDAPIFLPTKL